MMRSMFSAISGLKNHQTFMDVVGNNIANVNTTGFKAGRLDFQDVLNQTLRGATAPTATKGGVNAYEMFLKAMECFERAEAMRPHGNDDAILRWNGCARIIKRNKLEPREISANDFIE